MKFRTKDEALRLYSATMRVRGVPENLISGIGLWIVHGLQPGSFVTALIANNLREVFRRGDADVLAGLPAIMMFLLNDAPAACWGSKEAFAEWRGIESET